MFCVDTPVLILKINGRTLEALVQLVNKNVQSCRRFYNFPPLSLRDLTNL